jgi:hypothetical protein
MEEIMAHKGSGTGRKIAINSLLVCKIIQKFSFLRKKKCFLSS